MQCNLRRILYMFIIVLVTAVIAEVPTRSGSNLASETISRAWAL